MSRKAPDLCPVPPVGGAVHTDRVGIAPPSGAAGHKHHHTGGVLEKFSEDKSDELGWGASYLSCREPDRSWYYRLVAPEASGGADSWRQAGPAAHSGPSASAHPLRRSPCTAEGGERKESAALRGRVLVAVRDVH